MVANSNVAFNCRCNSLAEIEQFLEKNGIDHVGDFNAKYVIYDHSIFRLLPDKPESPGGEEIDIDVILVEGPDSENVDIDEVVERFEALLKKA